MDSKENEGFIHIFDTTLRDGLQSPNITPVPLKDRVLIGESLAKMGVNIIEAGFAIGSKLDFDTIHTLSQKGFDSTICSLARTLDEDIIAAGKALKPARSGRIHTFISTSPIHREKKLNMDKQQVLESTTHAIKLARNLIDDVQFSLEDFTRTEPEFSWKVIEMAIKAGATTINLPDTVGYTTPDEYAALIADIINKVPNADKAVFSTHCHNDLGLAVANSLMGVQAGARQIECSINGIGERAGNAAMEEIVMALTIRHDVLPYKTTIDTKNFMKISELVQELTGMDVQKNKAIVGKNAFAHESGIHQHGMSQDSRTYEIMSPKMVGQSASELTVGITSGRAGLKKKMGALGYQLSKGDLTTFYLAFMERAAQGRMNDKKLHALASELGLKCLT